MKQLVLTTTAFLHPHDSAPGECNARFQLVLVANNELTEQLLDEFAAAGGAEAIGGLTAARSLCASVMCALSPGEVLEVK